MAPFFRRDREQREPARSEEIGVLGGLREAVRGGTAYGKRRPVPAGRAERLGLTELAPGTGTALQLPFEFLRLGEDRAAEPELAGGLAAQAARAIAAAVSRPPRPAAGAAGPPARPRLCAAV